MYRGPSSRCSSSQGLERAISRSSRALQPTPDVEDAGAWVRRNILKDSEPQRWHRISGAPDNKRHGILPRHSDSQRSAHDLGELLGKTRRHFRHVGIDDVAAVVDLDTSARQGDDVGGLQDAVRLLVGEVNGAIGVHLADKPSYRLRQLLPHNSFGASVADGLPSSGDTAGGGIRAYQHEAVPHGGHNGVRLVPCSRTSADDDEAPFPFETLPAVAADVADPVAVVNFP